MKLLVSVLTLCVIPFSFLSAEIPIKEFTPVSYAQLKSQVALLDPSNSKISIVEEKYKFNDRLDGVAGRSHLEEAVYSALGAHETSRNLEAVKNGIYYMAYLGLTYPGHYGRAIARLGREAYNIGITDSESKDIELRAHFNFLLETNPNAKKLIADLGQEKGKQYVMAIAQCWYNPSLECRNEVLRLAKELVPERPPFPAATYNAFRSLVFNPLQDAAIARALNNIQDLWNRGQDFRSVQMVESTK